MAAFAGCVSAEADLPITALSDGVERFDGYTWIPSVAHAADGTRLDLAAFVDAPWGVELLVPGSGAEPNVGVTSSGALFVTTFDQVQRSLDQGRTWEIVHDFTSPRYPTMMDQWSTADPMLWVDTDTDRIFVNQMHPALLCTFMAWSDDDGETWFDRPGACLVPGIDHQKIMTARPRPPPAPQPVGYPNVLYVCNNKRLDVFGLAGPDGNPLGLGTSCYVSLDGGMTYAYETEAYVNDPRCSNINGHPAAFPDGTVVVPLANLGNDCNRPLTVSITEDNGLTWQTRVCDPDLTQVEIDADITVTPDGTAYMLYRGVDRIVHVLRTTDKFQTCDDFRVAPPDHTLSRFTAITSGDDGRIAMTYIGTRDPQGPGATPGNATQGTMWHLFVTTSMDADTEAPTFFTQQVTPTEDPIQVGCLWEGGGGGGAFQCRNLLDFIDMVRDSDGRWYAAVTDGCSPRNGCTGTPEQTDFQSKDRQIAVAVQDRGTSLFADKGLLLPLGLEHPVPEER